MAAVRLRPGAILAGALAVVLERRDALLPAMPLLAGMYLLTQAVSLSENPALLLVGIPISLMAQTLIVVRTSRVVLLGRDSVGGGWLPAWGERETRALLYFVVVVMISIVVMSLVGALLSMAPREVVMLVMFGMVMLIVTRLSLLFPAIAADHAVNLQRAWQLSRAHQFVLPLFVILVPGVLAIPGLLLLQLGMWAAPVVVILNVLGHMYSAAALALAYHEALRIEGTPTEQV